MKKIKLTGELLEYTSLAELSRQDRKLISLAAKAAQSAYAPYSEFRVGAAVLLVNGKSILGSNQENIAYPSGLCAERVALFSAGAQFPNTRLIAIAITYHFPTEKENSEAAITPCGSCRQVIAEYEKKQKKKIRILMNSPKGKTLIADGIENLLPMIFEHEELREKK